MGLGGLFSSPNSIPAAGAVVRAEQPTDRASPGETYGHPHEIGHGLAERRVNIVVLESNAERGFEHGVENGGCQSEEKDRNAADEADNSGG